MKAYYRFPKNYLFLSILCGMLMGCTNQQKDGVYYESNGLIVIEAESADSTANWEKGAYYTGYSMVSFEHETSQEDELSYKVEFKREGEYSIWLLGRRYSWEKEENFIPLELRDASGNVVQAFDYQLPSQNALEWVNSGSISVPENGLYSLVFKSGGKGGYIIDKITLSNAADYEPAGYGLPETSVRGLNVREIKKEEEIVLPPAWAFGILYGGYTNQVETESRITTLIEGDYPIDAYWIDSWFWDYEDEGGNPSKYIDFKGDKNAFPDMKGMWDFMENHNIKSGIWIWDAIHEDGNEEVFHEFYSRSFFADTFLNTNGWHNRPRHTMMGQLDFKNPYMVAYWKNKLKPFFDQGLDFLKLDRSSDIPYSKAAFEATQEFGKETEGRGFILAHLHSTYDPRFKKYPTKWTGDAKIAWNQPDYPNLGNYSMGAYKENIEMMANPRLTTYEIPFAAHDIGGFNFFGSTEMGDELYMRWVQFGMMNPVSTFFSTADNPTSNMPYMFGKQAQDNFRVYAHLKARLFPYIYSYAHLTRVTGEKMVQGTSSYPNQYLFGKELLVAPVYIQGATSRTLNLPEGKWVHFWSKEEFSGGQEITVDSPIDELPLFARQGGIIPMREYSRSVEAGKRDLIIHVYAGADGSFDLYEDDGISNGYMDGEIAVTTFEWDNKEGMLMVYPTKGSFKGMPESRSIKAIVHSEGQEFALDSQPFTGKETITFSLK